MHTLTERYLAAAAAHVPEAQREEFRRELAERIADTIDARREAGESEAQAEHATLTELGDPLVLTAAYTDRPLHLVGPRFYLLWRHLMRLIVPIASVATAAAVTIGNLAEGVSAGSTVADAVGTAVNVAVWSSFWITVVFAILERVPAGASAERDLAELAWRPERLPEITEATDRELRRDQVATVVWLAVLAAVVFSAQRLTFFWTDGEPQRVPVFVPDTWAWLRWALLAVIAVEIGLAIRLLVRRRRTWAHAVGTLVCGVAFAAVTLPPLLAGELINPEVFEATGWTSGAAHLAPGGVGVTIGVLVVLAVALVDPVESFVRTYRERRRGTR